MRSAGLVLAGLLLSVALAAGQPGTPAPKVVFDPKTYPEDWLLAKWELSMDQVKSLVAKCDFISKDKVLGVEDKYSGQAKYLRSGVATMGSLELFKLDSKGAVQKDVFKKYIFSGNFLYEMNSNAKLVTVLEVPKQAAGQGMDNNLLSFIFGMKAEQAKERYHLKYVTPANPGDYYYLEIYPKKIEDKQDFKRARLVYQKANFLVRQVWFEEANGNEVSWDFPQATMNADLKATDFAAPAVPKDWRMEKVPGALGKPKVIHGQS